MPFDTKGPGEKLYIPLHGRMIEFEIDKAIIADSQTTPQVTLKIPGITAAASTLPDLKDETALLGFQYSAGRDSSAITAGSVAATGRLVASRLLFVMPPGRIAVEIAKHLKMPPIPALEILQYAVIDKHVITLRHVFNSCTVVDMVVGQYAVAFLVSFQELKVSAKDHKGTTMDETGTNEFELMFAAGKVEDVK